MDATQLVAFTIVTPGGSEFHVRVLQTETVRDICLQIEQQHKTPPGTQLKLVQNNEILEEESPVGQLDPSQLLLAVVSRESRVEILLQVASTYKGYADLLGAASRDAVDEAVSNACTVTVAMPSILAVLEDMAGQTPDMKDLRPVEDAGEAILQFNGESGALLLPCLDAAPLLAAQGVELVSRVTIRVGMNSDSYNRGLGLVLEASPAIDVPTPDGELRWYCDSSRIGVGVDGRACSATVKFHPGMTGGQLRVEGLGGWMNQGIGFTPENSSSSGGLLHLLELTVGSDGTNEVCIRSAQNNDRLWRKCWHGKLFDGRHVPAVHAWLDLGGIAGQPLFIGPISLCFHLG